MGIEKEILMRKKLDIDKLIKYGFNSYNNCFKYSKNIMNDSFRVDILINENLEFSSKIYDLSTNDVYLTYLIESQSGEFVNKVRDEYKNLLEDIVSKCCSNEFFSSSQANEIVYKIKDIYDDDAEFLWKNDKDTCIFRNKDNKKWYALMTNINKGKLDNLETSRVDILNIKLNHEKILELLNKKGFYKAYHMNKKYWITIVLDGTVDSDLIVSFIKESHRLTEKK